MTARDEIYVKWTADNKEFMRRMDSMEKKLGTLDNKVTKSTTNMTAQFKKFGGALGVYFGGRELLRFGRQAVDTSIRVEGLNIALRTVFGSVEAAEREMQFLRDETERLGLNTLETADSYIKLSAAAKDTALEGRRVKELFLAVAEASSVLNLSSQETAGAIRALEQMVSKGVVSMEELRLQLGDRIPGVMKIAARAMNLGVKEFQDLVASGELLTEDFIPRFSKQLRSEFAGGVEEATKSARASFARLQNSIDDFMNSVGAPLADLLAGIVDGFSDAAVAAREFGEALASADARNGSLFGVTNIREEYNKQIRGIESEIKNLEELQAGTADESMRKVLDKQLAFQRAFLDNMVNVRNGAGRALKVPITSGQIEEDVETSKPTTTSGLSDEENKKLQRRADIIKKDIMTAYEKYKIALQEINSLHEKGFLLDGERAKAVEKLTEEYNQLHDETTLLAKTMEEELVSALSRPIRSFGDLKEAALDALQQIIVKAIQTNFELGKLGSGASGNGFGGLLNVAAQGLIGAFGGGSVVGSSGFAELSSVPVKPLAGGGRAQAGRPHVVGEREPELFVPGVSGTVLNGSQMQQIGGQKVVVQQTIQVSTGVQDTIRAEMIRMLPVVKDQAISGIIEANNRGGLLSKTLGSRV